MRNPQGPKRITKRLVTRTLKIAQKLIEEPMHWGKRYMAQCRMHDSHGTYLMVTTVDDENANCFCAMGAVSRATREIYPVEHTTIHGPRTDLFLRMCQRLRDAIPQRDGFARMQLAEFNDDPAVSHRRIMNLFDRAIEDRKGK